MARDFLSSSLFFLFLPIPSSSSFFPYPPSPFSATHRGASTHHLSNKIDNIHHLFLLYLIINFFFIGDILSFQTAIFIVRSWPPKIVFRQITIIKVLSFVFPTKPTKKNHVWMTLLRRPPQRKTSPPCRKFLFYVSSGHKSFSF